MWRESLLRDSREVRCVVHTPIIESSIHASVKIEIDHSLINIGCNDGTT